MSLAADILDLARAKQIKIAIAESCTGGLVVAALTDVPGSSDVIDRGFVTYSNAAKTELLGVQSSTLDDHGAVSEPVASEMALGGVLRSPADLCVSITGIAGPGGSEFKPEGRVCFGLAKSGVATQTETQDFGALGRSAVRQAACGHALALLKRALL